MKDIVFNENYRLKPLFFNIINLSNHRTAEVTLERRVKDI